MIVPRIRSGSAVLAVIVNMLLIPLLSAGITHLAPPALPFATAAAFGIAVLTCVAWLFRPTIGAVLQIAIGLVIAAIPLVPHDGHFVLPRNAFELALAVLLVTPLAASFLAAVVSHRAGRGRGRGESSGTWGGRQQ